MKPHPEVIQPVMHNLIFKIVRNVAEKMPEDEKTKLRELFSLIPKEDWRTGELTIDWLQKVMRRIS